MRQKLTVFAGSFLVTGTIDFRLKLEQNIHLRVIGRLYLSNRTITKIRTLFCCIFVVEKLQMTLLVSNTMKFVRIGRLSMHFTNSCCFLCNVLIQDFYVDYRSQGCTSHNSLSLYHLLSKFFCSVVLIGFIIGFK